MIPPDTLVKSAGWYLLLAVIVGSLTNSLAAVAALAVMLAGVQASGVARSLAHPAYRFVHEGPVPTSDGLLDNELTAPARAARSVRRFELATEAALSLLIAAVVASCLK